MAGTIQESTTPRHRGFDLTGRRAIVVSGAGATGTAIASAFVEAGAQVAVAHSGAGAAPDGVRAAQPIDLASAAAVDATIAALAGVLGGLDVVAFVPEGYLAAPIAETSEADAAAIVSANLVGAYNVFRAATPRVAASGTGGRLLAVIGAPGLRGLPNLSALSATHAGILGIVRSLAQELGPQGITINAIATGWMTDTPGRGPDTADENVLLRYIPMRRFGAPDELAPLAVYLASDASGFVNGHVMAVDGGVLKHL